MANRVSKKMFGWTIVLATPLFGGLIYYCALLYLYQPAKDFYHFPVPRNAELIKKNEIVKSYEWLSAVEEYGIPFGYELVIKNNGWKKGERFGASVLYTKGNKEIEVILTREHIDIIKVN